MAERLNMGISISFLIGGLTYLPHRLIHRHCRGIGEIQAPHLGTNRNPQSLFGMCRENLTRQSASLAAEDEGVASLKASARILALGGLGEKPRPASIERPRQLRRQLPPVLHHFPLQMRPIIQPRPPQPLLCD